MYVGDKIGSGIYKVNLRVVLYHLQYWASQCCKEVLTLPRVKRAHLLKYVVWYQRQREEVM